MLSLPTVLIEATAKSCATGVTTHAVTPADYQALSDLHDRVFGPGALTRTAYRVREGLPRHTRYCRVARASDGAVMAFLRFAAIRIGGVGGALLLGPLAVGASYANQGHARRLIAEGLAAAAADGLQLVVLVGDAPYYGRLGFKPIGYGQITLPGPVDPSRLLAFELVDGALARYRGSVTGDLRSAQT
jgi:predicted N-acetyltransferase YhbS